MENLSEDHKPEDPKEKQRILKAGGTIEDGSDDYRVKMEPLTTAAMYLAPMAALNGGNYDEIFEKWRRVAY